MLLYSSGIRLNELRQLKLTDIDRERMLIRIEQGKGKRDRYTVLSQLCLKQLERYYRAYNPKGGWLFNGQKAGQPMAKRSVQHLIKELRKRAWISKKVNVHSFRHTFAVHFLEYGGHILQLQKYLGHKHLSTTIIYLQHTDLNFLPGKSPLDSWQAQKTRPGLCLSLLGRRNKAPLSGK